MALPQKNIILASKSPTRIKMLQDVGLVCQAIPADIDEDVIKQKFISDQNRNSSDLANILATDKASKISAKNPDIYVLGADQILICENNIYSKPLDQNQARHQLLELRGKTHQLVSAVTIVKSGQIIWQYSDQAELHMREFSEEFLDDYLQKMADDVLTTVGGYQLEGLGGQLFDKIDGSYFTILGLPLLPVLAQFRHLKILES